MNETTDAPSIFAPLWRRKWLILLVGILVAAGTYVYYKRQPHVYSATTQVFLGGGTEEQAQLSGAGAGTRKKGGALVPTNQAALINSSVIKEVVHKRLRAERKKDPVARLALHGKARATAKEKSSFITVTAQAKNAKAAALLANLTAQTYIQRQTASYRRQVESTIALARRQLRRIEASQQISTTPPAETKTTSKGTSTTSTSTSTTTAPTTTTTKAPAKIAPSTAVTLQEANLHAKINQLEAQANVTNAKQIEAAKASRAKLVQPKPRQNAIFGFAIGILLASIAAYVLSRLDSRLRSLAQIESVFQAPILTALPVVRRPIVDKDGQPAPAPAVREAVRRLYTTLKVGPASIDTAMGVQPRVLLFVSADPGDGRSTMAANLALAQREAGEAVAVLEADFRHPVQSKLLGVRSDDGLAEVLSGRLGVGEALVRVEAAHPPAQVADQAVPAAGGVATLVGSPYRGRLSVLLGGVAVIDPPALLARPEMADLLRTIAAEFDYVLIDAPEPLQVSDVLPLLRLVEGIVVVARIGHTSENSARRLVQLLARTSSAPVLGVAANAVPKREIAKYGFSAGSSRTRWYRKLLGR
jgi:Mrp family chromosome partitioning ATPase/capsular polysaccharide biosynthesis protein